MANDKKKERLQKKYRPSARFTFEFILFAILLCFVSFFAYQWMDNLLKEALNESVIRQSRTIAYGLEQQFEQELSKLRINAALLERERVRADELIEVSLAGSHTGKSMGLIAEGGTTVAGNPLPSEAYQSMQSAFSQGGAIDYRRDSGLLFAVPVNIEGEKFLLYERYDDAALREQFKALSFNGEGSLILIHTPQDWTILSEGAELINQEPGMQPGWDAVWEKHQQADPAVCFYQFRGNGYFIFAANVSQSYGFTVTGYAPWKAVAVGIDYIYAVMIAVFCCLLLLLFIGVRYVMKAKENKHFRQEKYLADTANRAKSEFLSSMSHEIRTPINAVMGMGEMILRESREPETLEYAENLQNAARNLLGIVNDILDFSKIEAGKMDIIPVEYALGALINDLVNMIRQRAEKKGLDLVVEASDELPSVLFGDEIRIKQVITNILTNAVKYTEQGSVTLRVSHETKEDETILLCVSIIDTGIGIKEEDMKKLFSAFERIEEERNRAIEGTGLGMNITRQLLKLMGTELHVESVYGKGSTFSFCIKQKVMNPAPLGDFREAYRNSLSRHRKYHEKFTAPEANILVVDDTVMNLTVVKGLLKQSKIQIDTAESGIEGLNLAEKNHYDAIFLDHRMPGMDGIETLQKLRQSTTEHNQVVPVIALTANAISGAREEYLAAGFQDYLTKPIDSNQLEDLLLKYLPQEKVILSSDNAFEEQTEPSGQDSLPDWLNETRGVDIKAGVHHCGTEEAYLSALKVFAESILPNATEIESYYEQEDWKNYTTKVHALKSSSRIIGAQELFERAMRLENAGNAGYVNEIRECTGDLLSLYRSYAEKLAPLLIKESDEGKPMIETEALVEAYDALREMAEVFDYDSAMYVLESLEEYRIPEEETERYKKIRQAIGKPDWEKLMELLSKG